jgi:hypothetical protein
MGGTQYYRSEVMYKLETSIVKLEALHYNFAMMSDSDLLRFGEVVKHRCLTEQLDHAPLVELWEARAEWRKRHPELPLSPSI